MEIELTLIREPVKRKTVKHTTEPMETYKTTWREAGRLSRLETDFSGGVYLFVHDGPPRRIIYVGTAKRSSGFTRRWCEHLSLSDIGGRTVWRTSEATDVYTLMTAAPGDYEACCNESLVWMPSNSKVNGFFEPYYPGSPGYEEAWRPWVLSQYLGQVSVWRCSLPSDALSHVLESQIQVSIASRFRIGYYIKSGLQSWLGRVEITDELRRSSVRFDLRTCRR